MTCLLVLSSHVCAKSLQSHPSVHGILQERILEWVVVPSSRGLPDPRIEPISYSVSCISRQVLYHQSYLGSLAFSHVSLAKHLTPGTPGPHLRGEMRSSETLVMRNDKHFKTGWANFFGLIASLQRSVEFCWLGIWANRSLEKMKKMTKVSQQEDHRILTPGSCFVSYSHTIWSLRPFLPLKNYDY